MMGRAKPSICYTDTGGTFTDTFVVDERGNFVVAKVPTTPEDVSKGYFASLVEAASQMGLSVEEFLSQLSVVGYGATTVINTILTRSGAKVGLIVTKGQEEVLLIERGKQTWTEYGLPDRLHAVTHMHNEPLVSFELIRGVTERIDCFGHVVIPLYEHEAEEAVSGLLDEGIEALSICYLWSFMNGEHERRTAEIARRVMHKRGREVPIYLSSEVNPVIREHSRVNTTVLEAYAGSRAREPLLEIDRRIKGYGHAGDLQIMLSFGGLATVGHAKMVETVRSGPVGGVLGGHFVGELYGLKNIITTDVGGTSFDVGIITEGEVSINREPTCARMILGLPMIEVSSIGAGGGTLVRVDPLTGRLEVGPDSAGAIPGPLCYDLGGDIPTVTDADLIAGYLNPDYFLGGKIRLNKERAFEIFREKIADPLGLDVYQAAAGVREIADVKMRNHLLGMIWARGYDPADYHLISFGGAGPTHVSGYTGGLGFKGILVFPFAAVFSAFGACTSSYEHHYTRSLNLLVPPRADQELKAKLGGQVNEAWAAMEDAAYQQMEREGFPRQLVTLKHQAMIRYAGQLNDLVVASPLARIDDPQDWDALIAAFEDLYERVYAKASKYPQAGYNIFEVGLVSAVPKVMPILKSYPLGSQGPPRGALKGRRLAWFSGKMVDTPVYEMMELKPANKVRGPALIEHPTTVLVVPPDSQVEVDAYMAFWLKSVGP